MDADDADIDMDADNDEMDMDLDMDVDTDMDMDMDMDSQESPIDLTDASDEEILKVFKLWVKMMELSLKKTVIIFI
jgi:hypothetical protein